MFLQEIHCIEKNEFRYNCNWSGKSIMHFQIQILAGGGVQCYLKRTRLQKFQTLSRWQETDCQCQDYEQNITLVNVYAFNKDSCRICFFKRLKTYIYIHKLLQTHVILCGDFNCNMNNINDKSAKILKDCLQILVMNND